MNLITDPWIPVRCQSGAVRIITPLQINDPTDLPIELAAMRPDFNGALAQFLVGLLQWLAPASASEWREEATGVKPLDLDRLHQLASCFDFDTGPRRFMQDMDFEPSESGALSFLLLEAPGENTVKNNADLFIKRRDPIALSLPLAAQTLLTLQINAPSGGQGHRTSLRGGGPVSMLLWPRQMGGTPTPLWQKLWLNTTVLQGEEPRTDIVFPWTSACITSENNRDVRSQIEAKSPSAIELALLCYFATPRRIRLNFDGNQTCAFSGEHGRCATAFETRNLGANYKSELFQHPLSPYYRAKDGAFLPVHLREIGFTYTDWIATQQDAEDSRMPSVLDRSRLGLRIERELEDNAVWAFGFAMDNMKCLAWHEVRYKQLALDDATLRARVLLEAKRWVDAVEFVRATLARELRHAWSDSGKGDTSTAERELYALTEPEFYALVGECETLQGEGAALDRMNQQLRQRWHKSLVDAARQLFERHAESADVSEQNIKTIERVAKAQSALWKSLQTKLKDILELDVAKRTAKRATKRRKVA